jgi:hypothetical protein
MRRFVRVALPGLLLSLAALLPFLGKGYTIDDTIFLEEAGQILRDPLHPAAFEIVWNGGPVRLSKIMASGPLLPYLLAPVVAVGAPEWLAHLLGLAALLAGILGTVALAFRLGRTDSEARDAALLVAAAPAVLGMAGTAMPDVHAMALGIWGVERLVAWWGRRRPVDGATSAVLLFLAAAARPHLVAVGPLVLIAFAVADARSGERIAPGALFLRSLPVLAVPLLLALLFGITRDPASRDQVVSATGGYLASLDPRRAARNLLSFGAGTILAVPFGLSWLLLRGRSLRWPLLPPSLALFGLPLLLGRRIDLAGIGFVAAVGGFALADALVEAWRGRDRAELLCALWLTLPLLALPYPHLPAKYLVAAVPAGAILVAGRLKAGSAPPFLRASVVAAGFALGLLILEADSRLAEVGRRAAGELVAPEVARGRTTWYDGEWGFAWYAGRAGARPLTGRPPFPRKGDAIVAARGVSCARRVETLPGLRLEAVTTDSRPGGRVMSVADGAGFFSSAWGFLPWAWGSGEVDRFERYGVGEGGRPDPP